MRAPIRALVDETPDITLEELRTALAARQLSQATARYGGSFTATRSRANKTAHSTERDRPDIVKRREPGSMAGRNLDPDRLEFNTAQRPTDTDGRRNGRRLRVSVPNLHSKKTTLSPDCILTAPMDLDRSTNGSALSALQRIQI
jgi:hypothetical protein